MIYLATLALAGFGGTLFYALNLPLPWMLGAMATTLMAALAKAPIKGPDRLRPVVVAVMRAFGLGIGATAIMLGISLGFAQLLSVPLAQDPEQILLAFAPGSLTETSLVSLAMGADVAYVATHHLVRVVTLLTIANTVLAAIARRIADRS